MTSAPVIAWIKELVISYRFVVFIFIFTCAEVQGYEYFLEGVHKTGQKSLSGRLTFVRYKPYNEQC